ncbi:hypothetical protein B0A55_02999 [Friedmanniomyces simplex]|uniref:Pex19-domain-containing protein n=1 Tax=Friedmanniomyces simplex TaxID=329884 RepID=A0A4U0XUY3_9PEZI|nr:hypothetical protein B0A55_02999 [Friedmanniomyces simplex]
MAEQPHEQVASAPDPEEDDLDDLDDVLDEFQPTLSTSTTTTAKTKPSAPAASPAPTASGPGRPPHHAVPPPAFPDAGEEALAAQLQAGMANLMSELDGNPDMQKQFEQMMSELIAVGSAGTDEEVGEHLMKAVEGLPTGGAPGVEEGKKSGRRNNGGGGSASASVGGSAKKGEGDESKDFSSTIRKTMARMQASDSTASASATVPSEQQGSEEDMLAQMLRELQASGGGEAGGEAGEGDFNSMLMNMMTQLTNKEILYEPMKELHDKFPAWMAKQDKGEGKEKVSKEDMARYVEQQRLVGEIVARFEGKGYKDENEGDREYIVERMQKVELPMQAAGSPPPDLVGDMSAAQEALGEMDAGCPTQ